MYAVGRKGHFKEGFDERGAKVKRNRWINEKAENKITRMTAWDYCSIIS